MPLINLIQEQRLASRRNEQKSRALFMTFAATLVASVGAFGFLLFETESSRAEEARLKEQLKKNAPMMKQIEDNDQEMAAAAPRLKTLEDAQLTIGRWGRVLQHVATQTPERSWLTAVRAIGADASKPIAINFVGVSADQATIGEYMQRLQNSEDLDNVILKYTMEKLAVNAKGLEFEIDAELSGTAEAKPKTEEEK